LLCEFQVVESIICIFVTEQPQEAPDTKMKMNQELLVQITSDLGLDRAFVRGQKITVKNCWHFH